MITSGDSVGSTGQSRSGYCLSDICLTLYKMQMAGGDSILYYYKGRGVFTYLDYDIGFVYVLNN